MSVNRKFLALGLLLSFFVSSMSIDEESLDEVVQNAKLKNYKLPTALVPNSYNIKYKEIDLEKSTFSGDVTIKVTVIEQTQDIVLHCGKLLDCQVNSINIEKSNQPNVKVTNSSKDETTEKFSLTLAEVLKVKNEVEINLTFKGKLRDDMMGLYKSSYMDKNTEKPLASTQFEATSARHAFPCFDEPHLKAKFKISLATVPKGYGCLSNMPEMKKNANETRCRFDTSNVKMSTYLVAFVLSDFTSTKQKENTKIQLWSRDATKDQRAFSLEYAKKSVDYFEKLLDQKYQIEKMDLVAVPDFSAGAMENWGLLTFRESNLLVDKDHTSAAQEQRVGTVVVHEVAHQWFGNLVTPEKWNYLWLSEGFARYFEYMATDQIKPNWKLKDQFIVDQVQSALGVDSLEDSKAMTRNAISTSEIGSMGDTICYNKGASVLRMMEHAFGPKYFAEALKTYLKKKEYGSVKPSDLWEALQNEIVKGDPKSKLKVEEIMNTWTVQPGYPLISVTVTPKEITFKQERFLVKNPNDLPTDGNWNVPITWITFKKNETMEKPVFWLTEKNTTVKNENEADWVMLNVDSTGFYRVMYDKNTLNKIISVLKTDHRKINEVNRAAFVDDLLNLAKAEKVDYETVFKAMQYLRKEKSYLPIKSAFNALDHLIKKFSGSFDEELFNKYILSLISETYDELSFDDQKKDDHLTILLRQELINRACRLGHSDCVIRSQKYFHNWQFGKNHPLVPKNQRSAVYSTAIKHGTDDDWEFLWDQYRKTDFATEQVNILNALGYTKNPEKLEKYLMIALTEPYKKSLIRKQDLRTVFNGIQSSSAENAYYIAEFVDKNYDKLTIGKKLEDTEIVGLLTGALQRYPTKRLIAKVQTVINNNKITGKSLETLNSSLKSANFEVGWFEKLSKPLANWIRTEKGSQSKTSKGNTEAYRLPDNIEPVFYDLHLEPNIPQEKFTGTVKIKAKVKNDCDEIVLHSDQLDFEKKNVTVRLEDKVGSFIKPVFMLSRVEKYQFTKIVMEERLKAGSEIRIEIRNYKGTLNKEMKGFYISYYKDGNETRGLAASHLEPTGARRMFPCFDEPALKATFNISVTVLDSKYKAISNMNGTFANNVYKFAETPKMSTYLVAVVVSDFTSKSDGKYSVYANPLVAHQLDYSLKKISPVVKFFEEKLKIKYELPKLDMVALPDFASGAMENWGLLTYRETGMLYDKSMSTLNNMQAIRNVIAHELTHQWFGDLVSPKWWNYVWLSEGFARYFQYFANTEDVKLWDLENQFVVDHLQTSMVGDSTTSTHPVTYDVWSPKEIRDIFDSVSYAKAASLIRMVEMLVGRNEFYKALNKYLLGSSHGVGTSEKLFKAFQEVVPLEDFNVMQVMNSWTLNTGYPVINADFKGTKVTLKQSRFFLRKPKESIPATKWSVPITYISKASNGPQNKKYTWFEKYEETIEIPEAAKDWVILNANQIGYYRVNYDIDTWNKIIKALNNPEDRKLIPLINRAALINDLMNLGRAGMVDYNIVFSGLKYLSQETSYIPWKAFFNNMPYLTTRFEGRPEIFNLYKKFIIDLMKPNFDRLKFVESTNDSHTDVFFRKLVLDWLCKLDHKDCVKEAKEIFKKETENKFVPPSQRSFAYCTGIKEGKEIDFLQIMNKFRKSNYATEKMTYLSALACSKDPKLLKILLQYAITPYPESEVRSQDAKTVFNNVIGASPEGMYAALDFIASNYENMRKYFGDHSLTQGFISTIAKRMSSKEQVKRFEFLEKALQNVSEFKETISSAKKRISTEMKWYEDNAGKIFMFLRSLPENLPSSHRLEITAKPTSYNISLQPYFEDKNAKKSFTFNGRVVIDMEVSKDTWEIILHAYDIDIVSIKENSYLGHKMVPSTQKMIVFFKSLLPANKKLTLEITYTGHLRDDMKGFYRSSYLDETKKVRWIASTQFEPTHARRAFPCFDEPSFKATFSLQILKPPGYSTLSNMAWTKKEVKGGPENRSWDKYEKTVVMAPYVLAFIVSDFVSTPEKPTTVAVWSRKELVGYMKNAAVFGEKTLEILNGYTLVPYPLKEMNMVAIPDFSAGAMENWGLVTYREYGLSYNETTISASYRRYVLTTVAHELVHMWFGNLVTCDWWDYTWLNEGFAEYLSHLVSDQIKPDWQILKQFVITDLHKALDTDSSETSHPMNNKVNTPSEAQAGFDNIAYSKAASILRMLRDSFGHTIFQESLHNYLDSRKFKTAVPKDLVDSFQERANYYKVLPGGLKSEDVTKVMNSWIDQAGYPVISAERKDNTVTLTQDRFVQSTNATIKAKKYQVPITYTTSTRPNFEDTTPKLWLGEEKRTFDVTYNDTWYILNIQEIGFYRVKYDDNNWNRLIEKLNSDKFTEIEELNRAQIVDDAFNLARLGYISYNIPLNISMYLKKETSHLPWKAFFSASAYLSRRVEADATLKDQYAQHMRNLLSEGVKKTNFKEDPTKDKHLDQLNTELLLTQACNYGHENCKTRAEEYLKNPASITPNIAYPIYCTAMVHGNNTDWENLWRKYTETLLASDYITYLKALGCSRKEDLLNKYMELIITKDSKVRRQDVGTAFSSIYSSSKEGLETAIHYFKGNLQRLREYYGDWESVGSLFTGLAGYITTEEQKQILEKLKDDKNAANIKSSLESALKTVQKNFDWYKQKYPEVSTWLNNHYITKDKQNGNSASAPALSLTFIVCITVANLLLR